jgi:hypothetical protein
MSKRLHCLLCGRPVLALAEGCCSDRCRELRDAGYTSPSVEASALAPPVTAWEARAIAQRPVEGPLPPYAAQIASIGFSGSPRPLLRIGASSLAELEALVGELAGSLPGGSLDVFTIHRYPQRGLGSRSPRRIGGSR